jgi:hypothetical protein
MAANQMAKAAKTTQQSGARGARWNFIKDSLVPSKNSYKYGRIDHNNEMRVLKIYHGKENSQLECSLITKPLPVGTSSHSYCALSYTWGSSADFPNNEIHIYTNITGNGDSITPTPFNKSYTFHVRDNLLAALRSLRDPEKDVLVWVDVLCIDQEEAEEKTAQVARMDDIYGAADKVCIWLGEDKKEKAQETFDFLASILDLPRLDQLAKEGKELDKWELIIEMMSNRWFGRRWIIQELALAKEAEVRWGKAKLDWPEFAVAIELFLHKYSDIQPLRQERSTQFQAFRESRQRRGALDPRAMPATTLVHATNNLFRRSTDGKIQERLLNIEVLVSSLFRPQEAAEPRDIIYAVLSLARDTSRSCETPFVEEEDGRPKAATSASLQQVFTRPVTWIFQTARDFLLGTEVTNSAVVSLDETGPMRRELDIRLRPDYTKSLTEVFSGFVEFCIEKSQSLDILCRAWAPTTNQISIKEQLSRGRKGRIVKQEVPSWIRPCEDHAFGAPYEVPNGRKNANSLVGELQGAIHHIYNASVGLRPWYEFEKSPAGKYNGLLHVKGFPLASIEEVSGTVVAGIIPDDALRMSGWEWDSRFEEECLSSIPEILWRTLVADRGISGKNAPAWYRLACRECFRDISPQGDFNTTMFDGLGGTPQTMAEFVQRVKQAVWNRRFFLTRTSRSEESFYGFAPQETRSEDLIAILFGCSVPVVLRKNEGSDSYQFIGECYVHGVMDGEAIRDRGLGKKKLEYPYSDFTRFTLN